MNASYVCMYVCMYVWLEEREVALGNQEDEARAQVGESNLQRGEAAGEKVCVFLCVRVMGLFCVRVIMHVGCPLPPRSPPSRIPRCPGGLYRRLYFPLFYSTSSRNRNGISETRKRVPIFLHVCVCTHTYLYIYTYMYVCMHACMCVCMYVYAHTHTRTHMYKYTHTRAHTHTHTHAHTHTHTHTYTHRSPRSRRTRKSTQSSWPRLVPAPKARHAFSKVLSTVARYIMNALGH